MYHMIKFDGGGVEERVREVERIETEQREKEFCKDS